MTPAQAIVWARRIEERRALRLAEEAQLTYMACAAASGGRKPFHSLMKAVRRLRRIGGVEPPVTAERLAQSLGLTLHTPPKPQGQVVEQGAAEKRPV